MSSSRLARRAGRHLFATLATSVYLALPADAASQDTAKAPPRGLSQTDRIRLAEARRLIATFGDSIWAGWSAAPNALILITQEHEYLLWHPRPAGGFQRIGYDSLLATDVHTRPRQFSPTLAATFPAVGGVPTIVIGTAELTRMPSTNWVLTIAHEHFHQWQNSQPGYYAKVAALDLAKGDSTGMWMLNYAFPYATSPIVEDFARVSSALRSALTDATASARATHLAAVEAARTRLRANLSAPDYRYLSFQLWQEGIARYTEYAIAREAGARFRASEAFRALPDAEPFSAVAERLRRDILTNDNTALSRDQRVAFYPVGAALGLWLDETQPGWRSRYVAAMFSLDGVETTKR